ncbi:MAG: hypothetical protein WC728_16620 [Elusimicrobiota bacterium]
MDIASVLAVAFLAAAVRAEVPPVGGSKAVAPPGKAYTVYTDISPERCKTVEESPEYDYVLRSCPGVGGYSLQTVHGDERDSITVISPDGQEYPLDYSPVVAGAFSSLGAKAEWRVKDVRGKPVPVALIARLTVSIETEAGHKTRSYLAVAKIMPDEVCVTDRIEPSKDQNEKARIAADSAADKPCMKEAQR